MSRDFSCWDRGRVSSCIKELMPQCPGPWSRVSPRFSVAAALDLRRRETPVRPRRRLLRHRRHFFVVVLLPTPLPLLLLSIPQTHQVKSLHLASSLPIQIHELAACHLTLLFPRQYPVLAGRLSSSLLARPTGGSLSFEFLRHGVVETLGCLSPLNSEVSKVPNDVTCMVLTSLIELGYEPH